MMETPAIMFRSLCREIETEFIGAKIDSEENPWEWQGKINNIELWDMRHLENYIAEFSQYYYKIGHNETNLSMFYDKLPCPINSIITEKYMVWFKWTDVVHTLGSKFSYLQKWVNEQYLDLQKQRKLRSSSWLAGIHLTNGGKNIRKEEKENFIRKRALTNRETKNIEENITTT